MAATMLMMLQVVSFLSAYTANAASLPPLKYSAPGFYRFMLGDFEVTALYDGITPFHEHTFSNVTSLVMNQAILDGFLPNPIMEPVNAFLINTGSHLVLIDTGTGNYLRNCCGLVMKNLRASGYRPEQVDLVLISHFHSDHTGGALVDTQLAYPNAVLRAGQVEMDYWLTPDNTQTWPGQTADLWERISRVAKNMIDTYTDAGKFQAITGDVEMVPGIRASTQMGHTKGHTLFYVESRCQTLLAWSDTTHLDALQFPHPDVTMQFDYSPDEARKVRLNLLKTVAENKYLVAGSHIAFPGIGHVRKSREDAVENGFVWVPLPYVHDKSVPEPADPSQGTTEKTPSDGIRLKYFFDHISLILILLFCI